MLLARCAGGLAHRASQITSIGDLDHAYACVLLVLGAKSTIVGAAFIGLGVSLLRQLGRQTRFDHVIAIHVAANKVFARPVFWTGLAKVDTSLSGDDLRLNHLVTIGTEALSESQECVVTKFDRASPLRRRIRISAHINLTGTDLDRQPQRKQIHANEGH